MNYQELVHLFGANKKFFESETLFTPEEVRHMLNFPHAYLTTAGSDHPRVYVICDEEFSDSRFTLVSN